MNLNRQNTLFNTTSSASSIFGPVNTNPTSTTNTLFSPFKSITNPTGTTTNPSTSSSFSKPDPLNPFTSNPSPLFSTQPPLNSNWNSAQQYHQQNKTNLDSFELQHVIQNYIDSLNTYKAANAYKNMLYTRFQKTPQNPSPDQYSPFVVSSDGATNAVDYDLWLKAIQENPDSNQFIPIQISSPKQFVAFLKQTEINVFYALDRIVKMQKDLEVINVKTFNEISDLLVQAKTKKEEIKRKLLSVTTKMARLGIYTGYAEKNSILEKQIENNLTEVREQLSQESPFMQKLRTLRASNCEIEATNVDIGDYMKDMNKIRLEKNVNIMRQMKTVIDFQFNSINSNIKTLNGIQDDLNHLKRYGKFK